MSNQIARADESSHPVAKRPGKWPAIAGAFAALGVCLSCCLLPFALAGVGVAGAWVSRLDSFGPYKPILVLVAGALLAYGFLVTYRKPRVCAAGVTCQTCAPRRGIKTLLWISLALAIASVAFDYFEPVLLG